MDYNAIISLESVNKNPKLLELLKLFEPLELLELFELLELLELFEFARI